jgi:hypothetical protein
MTSFNSVVMLVPKTIMVANMPSAVTSIVHAQALAYKMHRLASMNKAFSFRLGAMVMADARPGKLWQ